MLDPSEKERVKYHMGYGGQSTAAGLAYGLPVPVQTLFLVESALDRMNTISEDRIRRLVTVLDGIECKMIDAQEYLVANQVDAIQIREDHIEKLEEEYYRWACRLADVMQSPLYPGAEKFRKFMGGGKGMAGSIPVRG